MTTTKKISSAKVISAITGLNTIAVLRQAFASLPTYTGNEINDKAADFAAEVDRVSEREIGFKIALINSSKVNALSALTGLSAEATIAVAYKATAKVAKSSKRSHEELINSYVNSELDVRLGIEAAKAAYIPGSIVAYRATINATTGVDTLMLGNALPFVGLKDENMLKNLAKKVTGNGKCFVTMSTDADGRVTQNVYSVVVALIPALDKDGKVVTTKVKGIDVPKTVKQFKATKVTTFVSLNGRTESGFKKGIVMYNTKLLK